jgi:hypothetical protein
MLRRKNPESSPLQGVIDALCFQMLEIREDTNEYAKMVDHLVKLQKLKEFDTPKRISPDTMVLVAGNLAGIILILTYENARVITSRAIAFVLKLR